MKYIIESNDVIGYTPKYAMLFGDGYMIQRLEDLEVLNSDYINKHYGDLKDDAYHRGLSEGNNIGYKDGVKDGQNEAWEAARKIALMDTETSENVTGYFGLFRIMENLTPMQAIEKLKAYEEKQKADDEIKVGDEVYCKGDDTSDSGVVTWAGKKRACVMWQDGSAGEVEKDELIKTNRHFDIASILKEMQS